MAQSNTMVDVNHPDNPEFNGAKNPDDALWVKFYDQPRLNEFQSEQQQRPVFDDVTYIEIRTPGDQLNIIQTPARPIHQQRFPRQWAHYKNTHGGEEMHNGTPLTHWPILTPAAVEMLKHYKFHTVDQIAFASDQQVESIGMHAGMAPLQLRARANAFLKLAKDASVNDAQSKQIDDLKKQMAEMKDMLEKATAPKSTETLKLPAKVAA
tara:strand:- start:1549 stop:2175 length:627 start_codon:yes stop_codon:yes gene_type:complete